VLKEKGSNRAHSNQIFPVSAAIVRDRRSYDRALESVSRPLLDFVEWDWTKGKEMLVRNETTHLFKYFDATTLAEYLAATDGVRRVVDMPDRKASLFVRLCLQNGGRLAARKRELFSELTDDELHRMEEAVRLAQHRSQA
jgi:hypothetical protein